MKHPRAWTIVVRHFPRTRPRARTALFLLPGLAAFVLPGWFRAHDVISRSHHKGSILTAAAWGVPGPKLPTARIPLRFACTEDIVRAVVKEAGR